MKFNVGDKVKVRSWESMKEEFGLDWEGDIPTSKNCFLGTMRKYCGKILTIDGIDLDDTYYLKGCGVYSFDDDMLEPAKTERKGLLDDVEREYLSNIVMPQGIYGKVSCIVKHEVGCYAYKFYFIEIELEDDVYNDNNDNINLPSFPAKAHMYERMVPEKPYTLAQLGIKRKEK